MHGQPNICIPPLERYVKLKRDEYDVTVAKKQRLNRWKVSLLANGSVIEPDNVPDLQEFCDEAADAHEDLHHESVSQCCASEACRQT